jgi:hypothetical protein
MNADPAGPLNWTTVRSSTKDTVNVDFNKIKNLSFLSESDEGFIWNIRVNWSAIRTTLEEHILSQFLGNTLSQPTRLEMLPTFGKYDSDGCNYVHSFAPPCMQQLVDLIWANLHKPSYQTLPLASYI